MHAARRLGLAAGILGDAGEAGEVLQEVFLFVWRAAATFDPARGSVLAWLLLATRSRAIDRLRTRRPAARAGLTRVDRAPDTPDPRDVAPDPAPRPWARPWRGPTRQLRPPPPLALVGAPFEGLT